ncbi:MAG: DIP1984 family protein [Cyanobacteriota bacterium]|nr:DIP1984 family protein [Cyanobacteriota bacterium]
MKLAEALILRADCQKRVVQLQQRLNRNAKVQEGETPSEDPQALLTEVNAAIVELMSLIQRINRTNSRTELESGQMLSDALAQRDTLLMQYRVYNGFITAASAPQNRYGQSEIKIFSTVNIAELQGQTDRLSQECRILDTSIQAANWNTELLD